MARQIRDAERPQSDASFQLRPASIATNQADVLNDNTAIQCRRAPFGSGKTMPGLEAVVWGVAFRATLAA